ncbi:MAG TPA: PspC domain-containing protein [Thermoanaerobaculia bacterium]|nr:PspC domain-containing protein [Thermoanaerobaculia bacterium]
MTTSPVSERRLRRSRKHRMVGGVIGGLAEYFDRDPTLFRVLYVLISVISAAFPGILVYLILWVVIPEAEG